MGTERLVKVVVSREGDSPRKQAGVAPVGCLKGHYAVITFESRQLGDDMGKVVSMQGHEGTCAHWCLPYDQSSAEVLGAHAPISLDVTFTVPATGKGRGAGC